MQSAEPRDCSGVLKLVAWEPPMGYDDPEIIYRPILSHDAKFNTNKIHINKQNDKKWNTFHFPAIWQ